AMVPRTTETLDVLVAAFNAFGTPLVSQKVTATLVTQPEAVGVEYEAATNLDLPPGHYYLRVSTRNAQQNKIGSVYTDAEIPDFGRVPISLSAVLLTTSEGPPAMPMSGIPSIPVIPTTRREFRRTEHLSAFWRIYQGGKAPPGS